MSPSLQYLMSMFFLIVRGHVSVFAASLFTHPIDKRGMRIVESKKSLSGERAQIRNLREEAARWVYCKLYVCTLEP